MRPLAVTTWVIVALVGCKATPAAPQLTQFEAQLAPRLEQHCASEQGCHGAEPAEEIDLDLRRPNAAKRLVGQPSEVRKGAVLVQPGNPEASFLLDKLNGRLAKGEGKKMPLDADTGAPLPESAEQLALTEALTRWIKAGAKE